MQASNAAQAPLDRGNPEVLPFFDRDSNTFSYVVKDPKSNACAIFDSVLTFDMASASTDTSGADAIVAHVRKHRLDVQWIVETHVHADHLTAAPYIQERVGGKIAIGERVTTVQKTFARIFNCGQDCPRDGSQFDHLFKDGEEYHIGSLIAQTLHTPGHTPACMTHVIGDAAFVGDTLFMPDSGTARADFPGGDAATLYHSIQKILSLPAETRLFMCHDYAEGDRELAHETTVAAELAGNIHIRSSIGEEEFVNLRESRDRELEVPHLILPSLQVNMRAGHFPPAEDNGKTYLKLPLNVFKQS